MTHDELQQLLGAYAIDAVDPEEADAVAAHLVECPRCRAEVADLREVAAHLSHTGADAPAGLWDKISGSLSETPPPLQLHVSRPWQEHRLALVGIAAAVLVIAGLSVGMLRLRSEVSDLRSKELASGVAAAATTALSEPGTRIAQLAGPSGETATAIVQTNGQGYFLGSTLSALDRQIYQLWGASGSGVLTSLGTVPGPGDFAFAADPSIRDVMVSIEAAPVASPSSAPVLRGTLA